MKQIFTSLFIVAILFTSTSVMAEEKKEADPKAKTETVKTEETACCEKEEKKECCEKDEKTSEKNTGSESKSCGKK